MHSRICQLSDGKQLANPRAKAQTIVDHERRKPGTIGQFQSADGISASARGEVTNTIVVVQIGFACFSWLHVTVCMAICLYLWRKILALNKNCGHALCILALFLIVKRIVSHYVDTSMF